MTRLYHRLLRRAHLDLTLGVPRARRHDVPEGDPMTTPVTAPGVYDIPEHEYHADPIAGGSLSSSGARKLLTPGCPALYRHSVDHGNEHKAAFDFGHAAHKLVLGVGAEIVPVDADDWRTKAAKEAKEAAYAAGKVPLLVADVILVHNMADAIRNHPVASALFDPERGKAEQSLFWPDIASGVWLRSPPRLASDRH